MGLASISRRLSTMLVIFLGTSLLVSSLIFILGYKISILNLMIPFLLTLLYNGWSLRKSQSENFISTFFIQILLFMVIFAASILFAGYFYDISNDGQVYHQEAIIQLAEGWNPYYQELPQSESSSLWINHYAKGPWIYESVLYKISGKIEYSKSFNIVLIISVFLLSFSTLLELQNNRLIALLMSFIFAFNPVSVNQSLSFYIDGQLASLFALLVLLIYLIIYKKYDGTLLITMILSLILLINVKFTGLVYAVVLAGGFIILGLKNRRNYFKHLLIAIAAAFIIGIFIVGYNPYITNTLAHGHPFYPLYNSNVDIMSPQASEEYLSKNRFEQLFISIFANSQNVLRFSVPEIKWPFTVKKNELKAFVNPDTRIGGFGPLFGGAVLITAGICIFTLRRCTNGPVFVTLLLIFLSVIVNPQCWWARYVPQLWLIPVITATNSFYLTGDRINKWLGILIMGTLSFNLILTTGPYLSKQYMYSHALKEQLSYLNKYSKNKLIHVNFGHFQSNRVRLKEAGIKFEANNTKNQPYPVQLISSETTVFVDEPKAQEALQAIRDYAIKLKSL